MKLRPHQIASEGAGNSQALLYDTTTGRWSPGNAVIQLVAGSGITIDSTNPKQPIVAATGGGGGGGGGGGFVPKINDACSSLAGFKTPLSGTWAINAGVIRQSSTAASASHVSHNTPLTPSGVRAVEVEMSYQSGASSPQRMGINVSGKNVASGDLLVYLETANGTSWSIKAEAAGVVVLQSAISVAYAGSGYVKLGVIQTGSMIDYYFGGVWAGSFDASGGTPFSPGALVGLYTYQAAVDFKNLKAWTSLPEPFSGSSSATVSFPPGSADVLPGSPNTRDDEFNGTSSATWSSTPTAPNTSDVNTTRPHHAYLKASGSGAAYVGKLQAVPGSYPYTITAKLSGTTRADAHHGGGIVLGPASPTGSSSVAYFGAVNITVPVYKRIMATFAGTLASQSAAMMSNHVAPYYVKVTVNSATSVDSWVSADGWAWIPLETGLNPGFTPGVMGLACNEETAGGGVEVYSDFFRVT